MIEKCLFCLLLTFPMLTVNSNPTTAKIPVCHPGNEPDGEGGCKACLDGYYSRSGIKCSPCTKCHKGQQVLHPCKTTRNTVCLCPPKTYLKAGLCIDCTNCPAGLFQERDCGHNLNRQCQECPKGYSTNHTNAKKCLPNTHSKPAPPPTTNEYHYHNYGWKLILSNVAIGVLLIIILAIIFYCVRRRKQRQRLQIRNNNNATFEDDVNIPLTYTFPEEANGNYVLIENIRYTVIENLASKLNPEEPNNWRTLACYLNISNDRIKNLALQPLNATQELLGEWGINRNATVYALHDILMNYMNRPDAAAILEPHLLNEQVSTV